MYFFSLNDDSQETLQCEFKGRMNGNSHKEKHEFSSLSQMHFDCFVYPVVFKALCLHHSGIQLKQWWILSLLLLI